MLWRVFCSPPFCRRWGCAPAVAVYLQKEWAVEREDNWLVDLGSRNAVSILWTIVQLSCSLPIVGYHRYKETWSTIQHTHTLYFSNLTVTIQTSVITCVHCKDFKFTHHLSGKLGTHQASLWSQAIPVCHNNRGKCLRPTFQIKNMRGNIAFLPLNKESVRPLYCMCDINFHI